MRQLANFSVAKKQFFTAALLPPFAILILIIKNAVNVPFWDQWELVPVIEHASSGQLAFNDFWQQHNEHRIFFPKLIMLSAAALTHWNIVIECLIGFGIALTSFFILKKTWDLKLRKNNSKNLILLVLLVSIIWFSPAQFDNWLWGWQIQWFLSVLGVLLAVYALSKLAKQTEFKHLLFLLIGGLVASYSLGSGVIIWPLIILALADLKIGLVKIILVGFVGFLTSFVYFLNYVNPAGQPSKFLAWEQPWLFIKYNLIFFRPSFAFFIKTMDHTDIRKQFNGPVNTGSIEFSRLIQPDD